MQVHQLPTRNDYKPRRIIHRKQRRQNYNTPNIKLPGLRRTTGPSSKGFRRNRCKREDIPQKQRKKTEVKKLRNLFLFQLIANIFEVKFFLQIKAFRLLIIPTYFKVNRSTIFTIRIISNKMRRILCIISL